MTETVSKIVNHGFYGGIFWREHFFYKKGDYHKGHTHHIDHATIIIKGSVRVEVEGKEPFNVTAPSVIEIPREVLHKFTALEDDTIYMCVFSTSNYADTMIRMNDDEKVEWLKNELCNDCDGCYVNIR